jgi:hypothetical protein
MWHGIVPRNIWRGSLLKYICITMLAILPVLGFAKGEKTSRWVTKPIVIDGNNDEWPQPYPCSEDINTMMQYAIANDAQTLYLTLKTSDETTKTKIRKNGLTIIIDTTGKKKITNSFSFSVQDNAKQSGRHKGDIGKEPHDTDNTAKVDEQKLHITGIKVTGLQEYDSDYQAEHRMTGITAAAAINDYNEIVWEIAISFKCIYATPGGHVAAQEKISICFVFYGLNNDEIAQLGRVAEPEDQGAMPVWNYDTSSAHHLPGGDGSADGSGTPVHGANGGMGGGKGGGKGKSGSDAPVIDATTASQDRQRAGQDFQVWKQIRLSYEP